MSNFYVRIIENYQKYWVLEGQRNVYAHVYVFMHVYGGMCGPPRSKLRIILCSPFYFSETGSATARGDD